MHESLPSGKPWYWLYLDERPEGVYVRGTNLTARRIAEFLAIVKTYANVRVTHPDLESEQIRASQAWWSDEVAKVKEATVEPIQA